MLLVKTIFNELKKFIFGICEIFKLRDRQTN